jgi:hypothetical protein
MPAYNAVKTLERTYQDISMEMSVNFKNSVIYGLGTLRVMGQFLFNRLGLVKQAKFRKRLQEVMSDYHWSKIAPSGRAS